MKVAIIGAGPSGLALAKELKQIGIDFTVFERNSKIGGLWDIENKGSPLYNSAHFISSKKLSGFSSFPMPKDYPDYPSHKLILKYLESFSDFHKLEESILFDTPVESAKFENEKWILSTQKAEYTFDALVCASGVNWIPNKIKIPGEFSGEVIHSVDYRDPSIFKNKRVLIIGAGNSACDIACDAALSAQKAYISMRRGYHFIPKHVFGMPADEYDQKNSWIPLKIKQAVFPYLLRVLNGDLTKYGLEKPTHKIYESHPILNSQLIHYLQHGDIIVCRDIKEAKGREVTFKDNKKVQADLIIQATGYKSFIPYLDSKYLDYKDDRPDLYLNIFSREWKNLMAIGFMETNSGAFRTFELMAKIITKYLSASEGSKNAFDSIISSDTPDLSGGVKYIKSSRHSNYINKDAYKKYLLKLMKNFT